jgi:HTH-type transcriptional regulator/antitoxin HigA
MPTTTASTRRRSSVEVFPIRSDQDLEKTLEEIGKLMDEPHLDAAGQDRLEVLSTLAEAYEDEHHPIPPPTAVEAIKFRLDQLGLTPKALEPILGSRSRVYEVLHGKRAISTEMMAKLWSRFDVPLEALIRGAARRSSKQLLRRSRRRAPDAVRRPGTENV